MHLSALIVSSFALLIAIAALVPSPPPNLEHLERSIAALRTTDVNLRGSIADLRQADVTLRAAMADIVIEVRGTEPAPEQPPAPPDAERAESASEPLAESAEPAQPEPPSTDPPDTEKPAASDAPPARESGELLLDAILERLSDQRADVQHLTGNLQGWIQNNNGDKCTYIQVPTRDDSVSHFYRTLTGTDTVLQFDDPECMTGSGVYREINIRLINNILANWYRDKQGGGSYMTRADELYGSSSMQIRGYCVQSGTRANRAFLTDYFDTPSGSIFLVVHNIALQGCDTESN